MWTTLGRMVKSYGLGDEPRRVLNELSKINLVDVVLPCNEVTFMTTNGTNDLQANEGNTLDDRPVLYHLSHNGYFPITTVHRNDLRQAGFNADNVDDATMSEVAERMADAYVENCFWIDLKIIADILDIPKTRKKKD
jgi:hypothetical protein